MERAGSDGRRRGISVCELWSCRIDLSSGGTRERVRRCSARVRVAGGGSLSIGRKCSSRGVFVIRSDLGKGRKRMRRKRRWKRRMKG